MDAVVAWVDGNDPAHQAKLHAHLASVGRRPPDAAPTRFRSVGEIDHCIAALLKFAPFLRRIHIVTDAQTPPVLHALRTAPAVWRDKVVLVDHRQVFAGLEQHLPTFNSLSIEAVLHRIPDLAEHFIYLNDDFMLIKPTVAEDFFRDGRPVIRGHWRQPEHRRWLRRLAQAGRTLLGQPASPQRAGYKDAQVLSAQLAGFADRYCWIDHHPHPMQRSMLEAFHARQPGLLAQQVAHRLRHPSQYMAQSLLAHLALAAGQAVLEPHSQLLKFKPASLPHWLLRRRLHRAEQDPRCLFVCVQSLDEADAATQALVTTWLDRVIGRVDGLALDGSSPGASRSAPTHHSA